LIYLEIFTVNIRSWKIHDLILAVTGISNKKQLSSVFELVFFYVEWKEILENINKNLRLFLKNKNKKDGKK